MYRFSERLAWIAGIVLPIGETLRRWGTWWSAPLIYFDHILIGVLFLIAAEQSRRGGPAGPRWLSAAFGAGAGMAYASWAAAMSHIDRVDPSGVSGTTAVIVKLAIMMLSIFGLAGAIGGRPRS